MPRNLGSLDNIPKLPTLPNSPQGGDICIVGGMPFVALDNGVWGGPNNLIYPYAMHAWSPVAGATTNSGLGLTWTGTGTARSYTPSNSSRIAALPVLEYAVTTASATAVAGYRSGAPFLWRQGGFVWRHIWRNGLGQTIATHRAFVGLRGANSAPTDIDPSTITNIIGMGWDAGDAQINIISNDGSGTATKIALGANFPRPTANNANAYYIELIALPGASDVRYTIINLANDAVATGVISTDIPGPTTLLQIFGYASVGGTSSTISICASSTQILRGV